MHDPRSELARCNIAVGCGRPAAAAAARRRATPARPCGRWPARTCMGVSGGRGLFCWRCGLACRGGPGRQRRGTARGTQWLARAPRGNPAAREASHPGLRAGLTCTRCKGTPAWPAPACTCQSCTRPPGEVASRRAPSICGPSDPPQLPRLLPAARTPWAEPARWSHPSAPGTTQAIAPPRKGSLLAFSSYTSS